MRLTHRSQETTPLFDSGFSVLEVPINPAIVALLLNEFDKKILNLKTITQLVSLDPVLATRLLQITNSGFFQHQRCINSVSESLAILKLRHVKSLVLVTANQATFKSVPGIHLSQFWNYSARVARLSRSLAGVIWQNQQAAYTAGLIHAMGQLAMHIYLPEQMTRLSVKSHPLHPGRSKAEVCAVGYTYAKVIAGFARKWHFPQQIVEALEHQCAPFENSVYEPLAGILHLASWRARAEFSGFNGKELAVTFPGEVGEILHLDIDMVLQQDPLNWHKNAPGKHWPGYQSLNY